jgi:hypothetical protein
VDDAPMFRARRRPPDGAGRRGETPDARFEVVALPAAIVIQRGPQPGRGGAEDGGPRIPDEGARRDRAGVGGGGRLGEPRAWRELERLGWTVEASASGGIRAGFSAAN